MAHVKQVSMLVAALLLGLLVSFQWPTVSAQLSRPSDLVSRTMQQLELEQQELKRTIVHLREQLDARQKSAADSTMILQEVRAELARQKTYAGLTTVRGPGIAVVIDDGPQAGGRADPNNTLVHDYDLRDVINVLWMAGAEALSVNDERIVHSTSIYCVGSTVMVNDTRMSPPYRISAIGDPVRLQDYLRNPGYLSDLKGRVERFGLTLEVMPVEPLTIPAYRGSFTQRFVRPGS